jgi:hypothetical protein
MSQCWKTGLFGSEAKKAMDTAGLLSSVGRRSGLGADATARAEPMIQNPVCRGYSAAAAPFQRAVRVSSDISCS